MRVKSIAKLAICYVIVLMSLFILQCSINTIPTSAIKHNIVKSIEEVEKSGVPLNRYRVIDGYYAATDDRPGDFAWLQIMYNVDSSHPIKSTLEAKRYTKYTRFHEELKEQIVNDLPANDSYSRYWHGMTILLRPLMTVFSLMQVKAILGVVIFLLWLMVFIKCSKFRYPLLVGFIVGSGFTCVLSVEFMPVFIITPIALLLMMKLKDSSIPLTFLIIGLVTAYFDFLTAETLTLVLPVLFLIYKDKDWKIPVITWGVGYSVTMGIRVIIAFLVNDFKVARILGDKFSIEKTPSTYYDGLSGLLKCIRTLIPGEDILSLQVVVIVILLLLFIIGFVCINYIKQVEVSKLVAFSLVGLIPVIRLIVLDGHAYTHSIFACRALVGTITALMLIVLSVAPQKKRKRR